MPFRFLPNTQSTRLAALDVAFEKSEGVPADQRPYPAEVHARLVDLRTRFRQEVGEASAALRQQTNLTSRADVQFLALQTLVSHFIQVFNFRVARGRQVPADRAFYGLDVTSESVPLVTTQAAVQQWAQQLLDGEAKRVAIAGQLPMTDPSAAELQAALDAYRTTGREQSDAKDAYDAEQNDVSALVPAVDELIVDLWDEIEHTFRKLDAPSLRRKAREWGVVYVTRPGEKPDEEEGTPASTPTPAL